MFLQNSLKLVIVVWEYKQTGRGQSVGLLGHSCEERLQIRVFLPSPQSNFFLYPFILLEILIRNRSG